MRQIKLDQVQVCDEIIRTMKLKTEERGFKYDFDIKEIPNYVPKLGKGFEHLENNKLLTMTFMIEDNQWESFKEFCKKHFGTEKFIIKDKK